MRLIVGMTGATGAVYGIRLLEILHSSGVETHLVMSPWAERTIALETDHSPEAVRSLASVVHRPGDLAALISSGTFRTSGMVIVPCSMRTLASIASGLSDNLLVRAADVCLKEGRPLVLAARETPLNAIHLENMLKLSRAGAIIMPPVPAYYGRPASIDDLVDHFVGRLLDRFGIEHTLYRPWMGDRAGNGVEQE